jgi:vitamin B12 transporter
MKLCLYAGLSLCALAAVAPAVAEDTDLGTIIITANRTATEASKVGSTVVTIGAEEIEARGDEELTDFLATMPGVSVSANGGMGQESTLVMRGADKKYVKTLFNGIDVSDVTAPQVQTSFEHLMAGGITGVEVLKGSQSMLYGSDAVAGVIGVSTLDGIEEGIHARISGEYGSFGTRRGLVSVTGSGNDGKFSAVAQGIGSNGISSAEEHDGNSEEDAYRNITGTVAGEQRINSVVKMFGSALLIDSNSEFDDSFPAPTDNSDNETEGTRRGARAGAQVDLMDGRFENIFSAQIFETDRDLHLVSIFGPYDANYLGLRRKVDYQGKFTASDMVTVMAGADYEWQDATITDAFSTFQADATNAGLWSQVILTPVENLTLTGGGRLDDQSQFGGHTTWRATAAYNVSQTGTKIRGSVGTGYRAPSLYELYDTFYGNPALKPEESISWDAGVDQALLEGRLNLSATYFVLNTKDLIDYDFLTSRYVQVPGTTKRSGVELSASFGVNDRLNLQAAYTYTKAEDASGTRRPRVPAHDVALIATWRPADDWTVTTTARYVADTVDTGNVKLDDYVLVNARIGYQITEQAELFLRGENLLNQDYQTVNGYSTPDISAYGGFTFEF